MIKISLDEAYVFDLLSIYQVKSIKSDLDKKGKILVSFSNLSQEIITQIGYDKYGSIINSEEYLELVKLNGEIFELVDRASESVIAEETANKNIERYHTKIKLQDKFFESEITETKL